MRILDEPSAAALASGVHIVDAGAHKKILIFDFGGGTLDVTILQIKDNVFTVLATSGDV